MMKLEEAKAKFIQAWGALGSSWGVSRTLAQIHAYLLVENEARTTEQVMEALQISRGNANMNLRTLLEWGLAEKELRVGERKELFIARRDTLYMAKQVALQRKKRELEPMLRALQEVQAVEGKDAETKDFRKLISDIYDFALQSESMLNLFISSSENWFMKAIMKLGRKR
jgi:DNA-binding transcriptional regulator GbsR (MarR family)